MNINDYVIKLVSENFDITRDDILGDSRKSELVDARCVVASVFFDLGKSLSEVGRILNRDHTTVMNMLKRIENRKLLIALSKNFTKITKYKISNGQFTSKQ